MSTENNEKKERRRVIEASFNINDSGWKLIGNGNRYVKDNINQLVNGDIVQERVERGVMVGFFGHESNMPMEPVENKDNPASHKTTYLKFYPQSGDVEHKQEIARTETGKAVISLHESDIGNFSWRGKGFRNFVGTQFNQNAARHLRFDYVYVPGMVKQEKKDVFIQESLEDPSDEFQIVLDRFKEHGLVIEEAAKMVADWQTQGIMLHDLEKELEEATIQQDIYWNDLKALRSDQRAREEAVKDVLKKTHFVFSDDLLQILQGKPIDEMFENADPEDRSYLFKDLFLKLIDEIQAYATVDTTRFPGVEREDRGFTLPREVIPNSPEQRVEKYSGSIRKAVLGFFG